MTNEVRNLLDQIAALDIEIEARLFLRNMCITALGNCIEGRKAICGYREASAHAKAQWDQLEKSLTIPDLVVVLDFLAQRKKSIEDLAAALDSARSLPQALRSLAQSPSEGSFRFNPANN
jgi:hypothetical protein